MAFDDTTRKRLARMVAACRRRLAEDISGQLQSRYGLYPDGTSLPIAVTEDDRQTAADLRALLDHFVATDPGPAARRPANAYARLVREIGFTWLNRLAALRLAEERGLVVECVRRGMTSSGFQVYDRAAGGGLGDRYQTYRAFLAGLFDELALDLGILFDRATPQSLVFPSEPALAEVLDQLNDPDLAGRGIWQQDETIGWIYQYYNDPDERKKMRDESAAPRDSRELAVRNQFFTPRYVVEFLTDNTLGRTWYEMRQGDTALADTCRYLVRRPDEVFLGSTLDDEAHRDNPDAAFLRGETDDLAPFTADDEMRLIGFAHWVRPFDWPDDPRRPDWQALLDRLDAADDAPIEGRSQNLWDALLAVARADRFSDGLVAAHARALAAIANELRRRLLLARQPDAPADAAARGPVLIPYRAAKDPRDLRVLDPACGSGHFLLYAFDLLLTIYAEAWQAGRPAFSGTGHSLRDDYPDLDALRRAAPGLILRHNLHGIDIDPRAAQIAALALWLRAQRAYQALGLKADERPVIERSHIVVAEPMPGDQALLDEFVASLQPPELAALVRFVFERMRLAGEAGSLLKIEAELADEIERLKGRSLPLLTDGDFWATAEARVLDALERYAVAASDGRGTRRRLFRDDAAQGFAFIDVLRQRYDVVLMNPPFGDVTKASKAYLEQLYQRTKGDVLTHFVERAVDVLCLTGRVGAITSRTCFFLGTSASFRERFLSVEGRLGLLADLGDGVLDATVETAAYVIAHKYHQNTPAVFFRLLLSQDKGTALLRSVVSVRDNPSDDTVFSIDPTAFSRLPGSPYAYWITDAIMSKLTQHPQLEGTVGKVRVGLQTGSDTRFLRLIWEISPREMGWTSFEERNIQDYAASMHRSFQNGKRWAFFSKTDAASLWIAPVTLLVDWYSDGEYIKAFVTSKGDSPSRSVRSEDLYFHPGFSYMLRSTRLVPYIVPAGVIPTAGRAQVFSLPGTEKMLLSYCASNIASAVARFSGEKFAWPKFQASMVQHLPIPSMSVTVMERLQYRVDAEVQQTRMHLQRMEPFQEFARPSFPGEESIAASKWSFESLIGRDFEREIAQAFRLTDSDLGKLERDILEAVAIRGATRQQFGERANEEDDNTAPIELDGAGQRARPEQLLSYSVGLVLGRWDIRIALDPTLAPELQDPFDPLPVCPPGMLVGPDGLPATPGRIVSEAWLRARPNAITLPPAEAVAQPTIPDSAYPLPIAWDGILVDDPHPTEARPRAADERPHPGDIVRRVRDVLALLWPDNHADIEAEACEILGVRDLRDYFRKPGGFFADHLKRYSKSRRQAPIYWPLSTASGSYTLWLYYHRLTDQTLYTAVNAYVAPKLAQVEGQLTRLEADMARATGRAATELRERVDAARAFRDELAAFRDELLRVAALPYKPNLNDGVLLTAAPLHRLFRLPRWARDTEAAWRKLEAGEYDWAHLAYTLWPQRVRGVCKTDKSIAIAHGLESLYVAPPAAKAKRARRKPTRDDDDEDDE